MNLNHKNSVYFIGIGGIGMSALARYFVFKGFIVGGYDKTKTDITNALEDLGVSIPEDIDAEGDPARLIGRYPGLSYRPRNR